MSYEPETVIITVKYTEQRISADIELPLSLNVKVMKAKILDVLKNIYEGVFANWAECSIVFKNHFLRDDTALNETGIYDGSCIYLVKI